MDTEYKYVKTIFYGYVLIILLGAVLLLLPMSHIGDLNFIDALYTATSATCVTGLIVVSTSENFTFFGEAVILTLIQIGGIGYMTLVTIFLLVMKNNLSINEKITMQQSLDLPNLNVSSFAKKILGLVLTIEIIGAIIMMIQFSEKYEFGEALWLAVFHSISSFNNAGFSLFTDNMIGYQKDTISLTTLAFLTILGGGLDILYC